MTAKFNVENYIGNEYNRWTVVGEGEPTQQGIRRLLCQCVCGNTRSVPKHSLETGKSKSCGCLKDEKTKERFTKHGMSSTPEFRAWARMLSRCLDVNNKNYEDYGARGIKVCQEFQDSFLNFYEHIGPRPKDGQRWSVGRIDNNRGYEIGNVRWETDKQQARNHSLQRNNTSGIAGVSIRLTNKNGDRVVARCPDENGKRILKSFSILRYGLEEALRLASEWRKEKMEQLGYAQSHGLPKELVNA